MANRASVCVVAIASLFFAACGGAVIDESASRPAAKPVAPSAVETPTPAEVQNEFKTGLESHGIRFMVESPNRLAGNTVTVTPSGLQISNDAFTSPANGEVVDAQIGDLNTDRSPEVYVFVRERGGNGRINVIAYGTNSKKSMSEFIMPEPDPQSKEFAGYNGNDEFEIVENVLSRRFPLFTRDGTAMKRTGKVRIVQYKIKPGEATWQFYIHTFDEF